MFRLWQVCSANDPQHFPKNVIERRQLVHLVREAGRVLQQSQEILASRSGLPDCLSRWLWIPSRPVQVPKIWQQTESGDGLKTMKSWQEDLLGITEEGQSEHVIFRKIEVAARALGFEHCAYGLRAPLPISDPKTFVLNNYPAPWQERYGSQNYLEIDPSVLHGRRTHAPLVWSNKAFRSTRQLWDEAQSFGLRVGWSQSNFDAAGVGGMLTLSRSCEAFSDAELADKQVQMHWLVNVSHLALSRALVPRSERNTLKLTGREVEILRWSAEGKTTSEVSDILMLSESTVKFHVKNASIKLQAPNKTSAVVRAAMLGLFN